VIETATAQELAGALTVVVHDGLPITDEPTAGLLLDLKSVYARAVVPSDRLSRLHTLNELLPRLIAGLSDSQYREAAQVLFGLAPGTRGTTLTARRRQAAHLLSYNVDHFRTRIEATVINGVAVALHDDLLRYRSRVKRAAESLEPTGDTPRLGPEHITAEEELVSRIWQHVYGLRAETIAILRLSEQQGYEAQAEEHRQSALREESQLRQLLQEYADTYGEQLVAHGDAEYSAEALVRLAAWKP
jgi:hypothetical protein